MEPLTDAQQKLVEQNLWLVGCITKAIHAKLPASVEWDDVEQAGCLGLIDAAIRHDPSLGASFVTFARWRVNGAIRDYLRSLDFVSKEERSRITAGEACEPVQMRVDDLYAQPRDTAASPEELSMAAQITAQIGTLMEILNGRQRTILREYYFQDRTMSQIGKGMGVKEARISQVHKKTIEQLRQEPSFLAHKAVFRFAMNSGLLGLILAFCLLVAPGLQAQTRVTTSSLAGTPGPAPRVWVVLADGKLAEADLENIQLIIGSDGKPILRATQAQQTVVKTKLVLTTARADYPLSGALDTVHRNGLLQAESEDYTIVTVSGVSTLRFNAAAVPQAGDIVQIREIK